VSALDELDVLRTALDRATGATQTVGQGGGNWFVLLGAPWGDEDIPEKE